MFYSSFLKRFIDFEFEGCASHHEGSERKEPSSRCSRFKVKGTREETSGLLYVKHSAKGYCPVSKIIHIADVQDLLEKIKAKFVEPIGTFSFVSLHNETRLNWPFIDVA
jgi:hypothetical protein